MQILVIINHSAARARRVWPTIQKQLDAARVEYQAYETNCTAAMLPAKPARRCDQASIRSSSLVATARSAKPRKDFSSSTTISMSCQLPINPVATLAILPAGTGDDFARGLRGSRAPLQDWIENCYRACSRRKCSRAQTIDVLYGRCNGLRKAVHLSQRIDDGYRWRNGRARRGARKVYAQLLR